MDIFARPPSAATIIKRSNREEEANQAGMAARDQWTELIRLTLEDAGVTDTTHIRNAQASLPEMGRATCFLKRGQETGTGLLFSADDLGFWVVTNNHCVPNEEAAERTEVFFGYDTDWNLKNLRAFSVELESSSPPWNNLEEINGEHLDYSGLKLKLQSQEDKEFLEEKALKRDSHLMNPTDSLFPVDEAILRSIPDGPNYIPLFMFSHPRGLSKRLSGGKLEEVMSRDVNGSATHLKLNLPVLPGSSGGNVLFCPLTGARYANWWAELMCSTASLPLALAVKWSAILNDNN